MDITTKFSTGQEVVHIFRVNNLVWVPCKKCNGQGFLLNSEGEQKLCRDCWGRRGRQERIGLEWQITGTFTIGMVRATVVNVDPERHEGMFNNTGHCFKEGNDEQEVEYMFYETGIRTGHIYYEKDCFATREEAQAECDRRNDEVNDQGN
jgi:hypothetical protein